MESVYLEKEDFEQIFKSQLKTESYSMSIETLFSRRKLSQINYKPYYQRNYVWDKHKATFFIESILIGTDIPPIIVYKKDSAIEVIDGRQRFETIKRFLQNQLILTRKGLWTLKNLGRCSYDSLLKETEGKEIIETFLSTKIRIFEFQINSALDLEQHVEDKIKKEIFRRYNSGITPLNKFDIDNAIYVNDEISIYFKHLLQTDEQFSSKMFKLFFLNELKTNRKPKIGKILQFVRRHLVLGELPLVYYARGANRVEISQKLYEDLVARTKNFETLCNRFRQKVQIVEKIDRFFTAREYQHNHLVYECLLWSLTILEKEGRQIEQILDSDRLNQIGQQIHENLISFSETESHYYGNILERFSFTALVVGKSFNLDLSTHISVNSQASQRIKQLKNERVIDTIGKLKELNSLRITKPEPYKITIDDIAGKIVARRRFTIRPAYQREEVINLSKASAIIESILLDIYLPPIFIFKRENNVSEVIDGQQRLLTILGFIGSEYIDEHGERSRTKNHEFALKGLRIIKNLNRKRFKDLSHHEQQKILDCGLLMVEIEERLNPDFDPIDLFVRMNDKPYPIKENSFEMWNSWVDRDLIGKIKRNEAKHKDWFFIRAFANSDGSRMENEELHTSLAYLEYKQAQGHDIWKQLYICKQQNRINVRIRIFKEITQLLESASGSVSDKTKFSRSIKSVESFIRKLELVLLDKDIEDEVEKRQYFRTELTSIFKAQRDLKRYKRAKQDFYVLWYALSPINVTMIARYRIEIKQEIKSIFNAFKRVALNNSSDIDDDLAIADFKQLVCDFHSTYQQPKRQLKLSQEYRNEAIAQQNNLDPISGAPLFIGDRVHADHIKPLAIGGQDVVENIQIAHQYSNLHKGAKYG